MTAQGPQHSRIVSVTRGGAGRTTCRVELSAFLTAFAATDRGDDRVRLLDHGAPSSATGWATVLVDTPFTSASIISAPESFRPGVPLPGPMYPNAG